MPEASNLTEMLRTLRPEIPADWNERLWSLDDVVDERMERR